MKNLHIYENQTIVLVMVQFSECLELTFVWHVCLPFTDIGNSGL